MAAVRPCKPGKRGRREMDMPARPFGEPVADQRGLVGAVGVHDDVNVGIGRHSARHLVEDLAELQRPMTRHAFADNGSGLHVEGREQRGCRVPLVIMRAPFCLAWPHRPEGLRAVKRQKARCPCQPSGLQRAHCTCPRQHYDRSGPSRGRHKSAGTE